VHHLCLVAALRRSAVPSNSVLCHNDRVPSAERTGKLSPRQVGVIAAVVAAPFLAVAWWIAAFVLSFSAGSTFGGFGATAEGPSSGWYAPVVVCMAVVAVVVDVLIWRVVENVVARRGAPHEQPG
jgi:hypothetical protein